MAPKESESSFGPRAAARSPFTSPRRSPPLALVEERDLPCGMKRAFPDLLDHLVDLPAGPNRVGSGAHAERQLGPIGHDHKREAGGDELLTDALGV